MRLLVLLFTLLAVDLKSGWDSLVDAELAFSRLSAERGIKEFVIGQWSIKEGDLFLIE